jgi:DNA-binding NarL/FixJ family response regulator
MEVIEIAIADDHSLFREGLRFILEGQPQFRIVTEASNGQELINSLASHVPDVILMDLKMPVIDGVEAIRQIKLSHPAIRIIVLTMYHEESTILHLLDLGANGYLLKNTSSAEVAKAIHDVMKKDYYFTDYVTSVMLKGIRKQIKPTLTLDESVVLTKREEEVLKLICQELTTVEIAEKLFLSDRTVESHRKSLLEKLHAKNTAGLVIKAMKFQIIDF